MVTSRIWREDIARQVADLGTFDVGKVWSGIRIKFETEFHKFDDTLLTRSDTEFFEFQDILAKSFYNLTLTLYSNYKQQQPNV